MKLLFDQNLSPKLVNQLASVYPNSSHVYLLGLDTSPDKDIWDYAKLNGYILVTKDADFGDMSMLRGFPPKVVWLRRGNCSANDIEKILRGHYADIEALDKDKIIGLLTLF